MIVLGGLVQAVGCQHSRMTIGQIDETPGTSLAEYEDFSLSYETDTAPRSKSLIPGPIRTVSGSLIDGKPASDERFAEERWSRARFQLIYPHPSGNAEKGLARLIITRHSPMASNDDDSAFPLQRHVAGLLASARDTPGRLLGFGESRTPPVSHGEEIWELDLPKEEIDILLAELSHRGFFQKQERPRGEALVRVEIDNDRVSKRWTNEPRLEELMLQVYNEGRLSAFGRKAPDTLLSKNGRTAEALDRPVTSRSKS
ncbi:hypothetical protein [Rubinisphaera margarita]|uniref:hypothetical protein n=1 Tax=Rubinisphaera margarita TaxID=2909586 RepID=UPI001EE820CD|nr:hypothetical protein [Rubinisphaera margarita]MCG6156095.1 hypothetical protein [Rubinisphaera margarita]